MPAALIHSFIMPLLQDFKVFFFEGGEGVLSKGVIIKGHIHTLGTSGDGTPRE